MKRYRACTARPIRKSHHQDRRKTAFRQFRALLATPSGQNYPVLQAVQLGTNMWAEDVTDTLGLALKASGCDSATVLYRPRLLSDNGPS